MVPFESWKEVYDLAKEDGVGFADFVMSEHPDRFSKLDFHSVPKYINLAFKRNSK